MVKKYTCIHLSQWVCWQPCSCSPAAPNPGSQPACLRKRGFRRKPAWRMHRPRWVPFLQSPLRRKLLYHRQWRHPSLQQALKGWQRQPGRSWPRSRTPILADVHILSVEPVKWRDACLGVNKPGMMCAQVITPGYRVTLELDGRQYVYHTDGSGSQIVLAETPAPQAAGEMIAWTQEDQGACNRLVITESALKFGSCDGALQESPDIYNATA